MKFKSIIQICCLMLVIWVSSCKKLVEVNAPITSITSNLVFSNDATATAALVGIYSRMMSSSITGFASGGPQSISLLGELSADGLQNYNNSSTYFSSYFYANTIPPGGAQATTWSEIYQYIYTCNVILDNLQNNTAISAAANTEITGEAKFIRAFCYFYLTNLFGDVPLLTTSNYLTNETAARTSQAAVYVQIVQDLLDAQKTLPVDYSVSPLQERVRPNSLAATALLARVYLYTGQWAKAETQATSIINNALFSMPVIGSDAYNGLNTVFLKNSTETIWALKPVLPNYNTVDANQYILPATGPSSGLYNVALSTGTYGLVNAFEAGDLRRKAWVGTVTTTGTSPQTYYYAYKYKLPTTSSTVTTNITEYNIVFRLAEQYLIRAEARAMQNNISGATTDINAIRNHAGLANTTAADQPSMVAAVLQERRVELFTEWGHRWFDLKRTNTVNQVMSIVTPLKGGVWSSYDQLYPIPNSELINDHNLTQNPGYATTP